MPLTSKGEEIRANMKKEYGPEKGEEVFYASKNAGTITGVDETVSQEWNRKAGVAGVGDQPGDMPLNPFPGEAKFVGTPQPAKFTPPSTVAGDPLVDSKDVKPRDAAAGEQAQIEAALPASPPTVEPAARSREIGERGAGRPAPAGIYGDSKTGKPR